MKQLELTPLNVPSGSRFKKPCWWSERRKPNPPIQTRGQERRIETRLWRGSRDSRKGTPFFHQPEYEKTHQPQTTEPPQQAVMTVTSCLLEIQIPALKTSVGSGLLQSLDVFERQVPCPVHPFLASNGLLLLQVLISLQGTALPSYQFYAFPDR